MKKHHCCHFGGPTERRVQLDERVHRTKEPKDWDMGLGLGLGHCEAFTSIPFP